MRTTTLTPPEANPTLDGIDYMTFYPECETGNISHKKFINHLTKTGAIKDECDYTHLLLNKELLSLEIEEYLKCL